MPTTQAHLTIVRNTSGVTKFFSFLGRNGAELAAGADYPHTGDLFARWKDNAIQLAAVKYAVENGLIAILKTPDTYVFDPTDERVYVLGADNGAAVVNDPDTGSYAGDPPDV